MNCIFVHQIIVPPASRHDHVRNCLNKVRLKPMICTLHTASASRRRVCVFASSTLFDFSKSRADPEIRDRLLHLDCSCAGRLASFESASGGNGTVDCDFGANVIRGHRFRIGDIR